MTGDDIQRRRESLGLTQMQFCTAVEISLVTLQWWELGEIKPPNYFEYALRYVEQNIATIKRPRSKPRRTVKAGATMRERFDAKIATTGTDCMVWVGANSFRLDDGSFASPRKAAWLLKYNEMPSQDVRLLCITPNCVAWPHLTLGRESNAGNQTAMSVELTKKIAAEMPLIGVKAAAAKFGVSVGAVSNLKRRLEKLT